MTFKFEGDSDAVEPGVLMSMVRLTFPLLEDVDSVTSLIVADDSS